MDSSAGADVLVMPSLDSGAEPFTDPVLPVQAVAAPRASCPAASPLDEDVHLASGISAAMSGSERKVEGNHQTGAAQCL